MARLLGPDANSRLVFIASGGTLRAAAGRTATVYTDSTGTVLANIAAYDPDNPGTPGSVITGSVLTVDTYSMLPLFWFPDGVDTVYVTVAGGPLMAVNADYDARLDAASSAAAGAVQRAGDTMTGDLIIQSTTSAQRRLTLSSYFETDPFGAAESIRLHSSNPLGLTGNSAKNAVAWYDDAISTTQAQVWMQSHDYLHWYNTTTFVPADVNTGTDRITVTSHGLPSTPGWRVQFTTTGTLPAGLNLATNYYAKRIDGATLEIYTDTGLTSLVNLTSQGTGTHTINPDNTYNNNRHRHFSIEVSNADLATKNTRLSIPWGYDTTEIGTFQANVNVNDGLLRVNGAAGTFRQLQFGGNLSSNLTPDGTNTRWSLQANNATESGSGVGSDFKIVRYSDSGVAIDAPVAIKRVQWVCRYQCCDYSRGPARGVD